MVVTTYVKRRLPIIGNCLDGMMSAYNNITLPKSVFVYNICNSLSTWYVINHIHNDNLNFYDEVNKYKPIFTYIFRTNISDYWEKNKSSK